MYQQIPGAHPTNDISIKFETQPKFAMLRFQIYSTDHNEILHMSRQLNYHDMCKILLWLFAYIFTPQPSGLEGYCRHGPGGRAVGRAAAKLAEPISR